MGGKPSKGTKKDRRLKGNKLGRTKRISNKAKAITKRREARKPWEG